MNPSHRALREATAAAHARVDTIFAGFDLADRRSYAAFLAAHADALLPIETALDAGGAAALIPDWPERKRGHLILHDLAHLEHPDQDPPAMPADPAPIAEAAEVAGALYVLEGSRLGGKMLARRVPPNFPRRYLDSDQPSGSWRTLLDRIDRILCQPARLERAIASASRAFVAFEQAGRARSPGN